MTKQAGTPVQFFQIQSEAIVPIVMEDIVKLVLVKPEQETMNRLRDLMPGTVIGPVTLIAKGEEGEWDAEYENMRDHIFVSMCVSGIGPRTSHVITLIRR